MEFREIVPYNTFYINELVEKVDIRSDYCEWIKRKNLRVSLFFFQIAMRIRLNYEKMIIIKNSEN